MRAPKRDEPFSSGKKFGAGSDFGQDSFGFGWPHGPDTRAYCSKEQKGDAAEMRSKLPQGDDRDMLSEMVHSGDVKPRKGNRFIDPTNSYDPKA